MKRLLTVMMACTLAAVLALAGCSGAKKGDAGKAGKDGKAAGEKADAPAANPYAALEADFCNPDKAKDVLMNDALMTFIVKMQVQMMKTMMPAGQEMPKEMADMMDEEKLLAEMKKDRDKEMQGEKPEFVSCSAKVTATDCDEIYKAIGDMISSEDPQVKSALGDPTKFIKDVAAELKIKDCGIMKVDAEEKKEKKKMSGNMYVGDVNGKQSIFFADKNSMN